METQHFVAQAHHASGVSLSEIVVILPKRQELWVKNGQSKVKKWRFGHFLLKTLPQTILVLHEYKPDSET